MKYPLLLVKMRTLPQTVSNLGDRQHCSKVGGAVKSSNMGTGDIVGKVKRVPIVTNIGYHPDPQLVSSILQLVSLCGYISYIGSL